MPLTHVKSGPRKQSPEPESEESGFSQAFAPAPNATTVEEVGAPPAVAPTVYTAYDPVPTSPTGQVRMKHQVGQYTAGSVVPANCFPELERLLRIGSVEYTNERPSAQPVDETIATGMALAAPVAASGGIARAPWAQASVQDILGPAFPRTGAPRALRGYTMLQTEGGLMLPVAGEAPHTGHELPDQPEGFADIQTTE